jgi:hypothetical protein
MQYDQIGKLLLVVGAAALVVGLIFLLVGKTPFGRLPGDITITNGNFTCIAPIVTMLLFSLILTIVVNILLGLLNRR